MSEFTMREKLNIPSNLRAMPRKGKRVYDAYEKRNSVIRYVMSHNGMVTSMAELAQALGFSIATAYKYTHALAEEGFISYVNIPLGRGRGTKVKWHFHGDPAAREKPQETPQPDAEPETVNPEPEVVEAPKPPQNTSDEAFVARVDVEIWDFIRRAKPGYVGILASFSNHLHRNYLGESIGGDTSSKEATDE